MKLIANKEGVRQLGDVYILLLLFGLVYIHKDKAMVYSESLM